MDKEKQLEVAKDILKKIIRNTFEFDKNWLIVLGEDELEQIRTTNEEAELFEMLIKEEE